MSSKDNYYEDVNYDDYISRDHNVTLACVMYDDLYDAIRDKELRFDILSNVLPVFTHASTADSNWNAKVYYVNPPESLIERIIKAHVDGIDIRNYEAIKDIVHRGDYFCWFHLNMMAWNFEYEQVLMRRKRENEQRPCRSA